MLQGGGDWMRCVEGSGPGGGPGVTRTEVV